MSTISITAPVPTALTAVDRCDRCGAAARVRAVLPSRAELLFCGHHAREHSVQLAAIDATLYPSQD